MKLTLSFLALILLFSCNNNKKEEQAVDTGTVEKTVPLSYRDSIDKGLIKEAVDTIKGSPYQTATAEIGGAKIEVGYSSPGVKGRIIWGGLVPYNKVWVTGAHQATSVQFSKTVEIGGTTIKAGKYAFFTIPGKDKWIAIINRMWDQHLADEYSDKQDIVRVEIKPIEHEMTQRLTYTIEKTNDQSGVINMTWEKISLPVPFTIL
jgi:hypothetical protein